MRCTRYCPRRKASVGSMERHVHWACACGLRLRCAHARVYRPLLSEPNLRWLLFSHAHAVHPGLGCDSDSHSAGSSCGRSRHRRVPLTAETCGGTCPPRHKSTFHLSPRAGRRCRRKQHQRRMHWLDSRHPKTAEVKARCHCDVHCSQHSPPPSEATLPRQCAKNPHGADCSSAHALDWLPMEIGASSRRTTTARPNKNEPPRAGH